MMGGRPSATCVVIQLNGLWRRRRRCVSVMIDFPCCIFWPAGAAPTRRSLALIIAHAGTTFWIIFQKQTLTAVQSSLSFSLSVRVHIRSIHFGFVVRLGVFALARMHAGSRILPSFLCEISNIKCVNAHEDVWRNSVSLGISTKVRIWLIPPCLIVH